MLNYSDKKRHPSPVLQEYQRVETLTESGLKVTFEPAEMPNLPPADYFSTDNLMKAGLNPDKVISVNTSDLCRSESASELSEFARQAQELFPNLNPQPIEDLPE